MRPLPLSRVFLLVGMLVLGVILGQWMTGQIRLGRDARAAEPRTVTPRGELTDPEKLTIKLFKDSSPSVVYITTTQRVRDMNTMDVFDIPTGTGSGFIWNEAGYIVTNFHVIQSVQTRGGGAIVTLADQTTYAAKIVGVAPNNDLAVLKIEPAKEAKLQPIAVGTSSDLEVGQSVFAIGNPFGLDRTLTTGAISALGRSIRSPAGLPIEDVIQTDAAINPGNSGGPLLDSSGRLIGVNTQIASANGVGQSAGIGFAVPVDIVNRVVPELIRTGRVSRAVLGVMPIVQQVNAELSRRLGIGGVVLGGVSPGSPAAKAGLKGASMSDDGIAVEDVILEVNGRKVATPDQFIGALTRFEPGQTITLKLWNHGKTRDVQITLVEGQ
ncbi:MAG: trypsin-like peptidase domain-containing protein [Tepidisphaeraceae bacterium]